MSPFISGMTWSEVKEVFDAETFIFSLNQKTKRSSKKLRKEGKKNDELIWCLLIQKIMNNYYTTIYRKNLHIQAKDLLTQKVDEKIISIFNKLIPV